MHRGSRRVRERDLHGGDGTIVPDLWDVGRPGRRARLSYSQASAIDDQDRENSTAKTCSFGAHDASPFAALSNMTPGRPKIKVTLPRRLESPGDGHRLSRREGKRALVRFILEVFRCRLLRHGTAHNSKPLPSFPGLCLSACPLQCRQKEHRGRRAPPPWFNGALLALPSAGARYDQLGERR